MRISSVWAEKKGSIVSSGGRSDAPSSGVALTRLIEGDNPKPLLAPQLVIAVVTVIVAVVLASGCAAQAQVAAAPQKPNILFIVTDDMIPTDTAYMPRVSSLLEAKGTTLKNAFVTDPLCCPSRTTILRGQYPHNHGVFFNELPWGGYNVFYNNGLEQSTVATWLDSAGYRTALVGKYLNEYCTADECPVERTHVPEGWDEWYAWVKFHSPPTMNANGNIVEYPTAYPDKVISNRAANFLGRQGEAPWFLWVSTKAPHGPLEPEPAYANDFQDEQAPRTPSFNEEDVSDKPSFFVNRPSLTAEQVQAIDEEYRLRLRTLQSVDQMVERLVSILRDRGELSNTYIFLTSDNGYHMGQHRLMPAKNFPYEEDIRVPLIVRGPHVPVGATRKGMVLNNDLAPTFAELAGVDPPNFVDGRSLASLLLNEPSPGNWRTAFMVEGVQGTLPDGNPRTYKAVRTKDHLYVEWWTGEEELYDLTADPYQLDNLAGQGTPEEAALEARLGALESCTGESCKSAEGGFDLTPPQTHILNTGTGALTVTNSTSANFSFNSSESGSTFECRMDSAPTFTSCDSPKTYSDLTANQSHTFRARAVDEAGNVDPTPDSHTWTIDTIAPRTTITGGPSGPTTDTTPTFTFSGSDNLAATDRLRYSFKVDDEPWSLFSDATSATLGGTGGLSDGPHTFFVKARDPAGNEESSPAQRSFRVDTTAPAAPVIDNPPENDHVQGSFVVSGTAEADSTVKLFQDLDVKGTASADDSGNWSVSLSGVAEGSHTYTAKATDAVGNTSEISNARTVVVDRTAPTVVSVVPGKDAKGVDPLANIEIFFSEAMKASSVDESTIRLSLAGSSTTLIAAVVSYDAAAAKATLDPNDPLLPGKRYKAVVTTRTRDLAGNRLDQNPRLAGLQPKKWFFTVSS